MDRHGYARCIPVRSDPSITAQPLLNLTSGYIRRASRMLPHQGSKKPWKMDQNYALDLINLRFSRVDDGVMEFARRA